MAFRWACFPFDYALRAKAGVHRRGDPHWPPPVERRRETRMKPLQLGPMCQRTARAGLVTALTALAAHTVGADVQAPPIIISAAPDSDAITIRGLNFGAGVPRVTLNSTELLVLSYGPGEIVARLPQNLAPASYLLAVYRAPSYTIFGVFIATIGPV